jgi:hypothetical protein
VLFSVYTHTVPDGPALTMIGVVKGNARRVHMPKDGQEKGVVVMLGAHGGGGTVCPRTALKITKRLGKSISEQKAHRPQGAFEYAGCLRRFDNVL